MSELVATTDELMQYRDHHARVAEAGSKLIGLHGEAPVTPEQADRLLGIII